MGDGIQTEGRTGIAGETSDVVRAEITVLPFGKARRRLAQVSSDCERLQKAVHILQHSLYTIEGFTAAVDDVPERGRLRRQIVSLNRLLLLRMQELSDVQRSLQEALRPTSIHAPAATSIVRSP